MSQMLTLDIPDDIYQALQKEANETGKLIEQVALEWMRQRTQPPRRGSVEAIMPFKGAWHMTPEERERIEREIQEMRNYGEEDV